MKSVVRAVHGGDGLAGPVRSGWRPRAWS